MFQSLWKRLISFFRNEDERVKSFETKWAMLSEKEVVANLDAIEQFIAIGKPVPDDLYRFLAWAVERACHAACTTGDHFDVRKQLLILEVFETLMRARSTTMPQRLKNDRYYMSNLLSTGKVEGRAKEIFGTLQQAIDRTRYELKKQDVVYSTQVDHFPKPFRHCLNLKQESWPAPLQTYLGRYAVDLVAIARGEV